jgi:signal transduction histidine kinase
LFQAVKKLLIIKPWYIALYATILTIILGYSFIEYQSRYKDLLQLIQDQAAMTAGVIAQSGSGQAYLTNELKQSYIDRAIDVLSILNKVDAAKDLGSSRLNALLEDDNIYEIIIYNSKGKVEHTLTSQSVQKMANNYAEGSWIFQNIQPIIIGASNLVISGVDQEPVLEEPRMRDNSRFLVAVPRDRGGAIACLLTTGAEEDFNYLTNMEIGLEDLLYVKGLQYLQISIDNGESYYVSKDSIVVDHTWTRKLLGDILYSVSKDDIHLLEVVRPVFFSSSFGEVRIGLLDDTLSNLRTQIIFQLLIRTLLLTMLAFVIMIFLISRQNATLLEQEKDRIEKEVYRLETLNRVNEKQVAMGELAAGVAHEIRNPLNAIGIVAQRLQREFAPDVDADDYQVLTGTMVTEIGRINNTLKEFLEYTRPTPLRFAKVNLQDLFNKIQDLYQSQAHENQVQLKLQDSNLTIEGDIEYLQQALANLIKNAIEACVEGDEVSVSAQQEKEMLLLLVKDTGEGIKPENLNRIFDLYYSNKAMGTGVGLALTHKIIADHQGTIEVQSEVGVGTTFIINLPVNQ